MAQPSREKITEALGRVIDPELKKPVTELGMVRQVDVQGDHVGVTIALTVPGCPLRSSFEDQVRRELLPLAGVESVSLDFDVMSPEEKAALTTRLRGGVSQRSKGISIDRSTRVVAVASGKGGVGKSTLTANLAAAFARLGQLLPRAEAVVVTTPQPAAQQVAVRAAQMAAKTEMRLLGAVENMSYLVGTGDEIFGSGGGEALAAEISVPLLGKVPFDPALREAADRGEPLVWERPDAEGSRAIVQLAEAIAETRREEGGFRPLPLAGARS